LSLLTKGVRGARLLGPRRTLQVIRYSLQKAWLDWWYAPATPRWDTAGVPPGSLVEADAADPSSARFTFGWGDLEVRFLAPDLVRVTWHPGADPVPVAIARTEWPPCEVRRGRSGDATVLASAELEATVAGDGAITFQTPAGAVLRHVLPPRWHERGWAYRALLAADERVHGLGERAAPLDLRPGTYRLWNTGPGGSYTTGRDPLYLGIPVRLGVHGAGSYLVFFENSHRADFSFEGDEVMARFDGGALRYYFVPGPPARALERYSELTGRPPLPPRWALGYHQASWGYASQEQVREVVAGFRTHDLPLSSVQLDIDYLDDYRVFTVDRRRFPDMAGLAAELAADGVRLGAIIDPGVQRNGRYRLYREARAQRRFCTFAGGRKPSWGVVWPGWAGYPDFTDPDTRRWWGDQYRALTGLGLDGFWHDMCEPIGISLIGGSSPPLATHHAMEGRGGNHVEGHNVYGLLMARAGYEGLRRIRPDRRPFLLSRSGWAGLQRWSWTWTGDTETSWRTLAQTVPTVLGLGLSGVPYSGPDVGGYDGSPDPELYLRWLQLAALLPFFRTHSSLHSAPREPWRAAPDLLDAVRDTLRLRYRLLPYLYTLAWEASRTGAPLVRPLWWPDATEPELGRVDDAFLLGESLLVAPVLESGLTHRRVLLPAGRWHSFWDDDEVFEGGVEVVAATPLERIPLYVRAGTVLPLEDEGRLDLHVWPPPPAGTGGGVLYRDAGDGDGPSRVDRYALEWEGDTLVLRSSADGAYQAHEGPPRVVTHGGPDVERR
jgi:alpha-glucosidase